MILRSIEANCFRNLRGRIIWGDGLNVLYGPNGQGKTNWLEAIHLLAHTKSFRTARLQEAIKFGAQSASISGTSEHGEIARDLRVVLFENTKQISLNGKRESISRYTGQLHAVAFTADELDIVRGVPEARRRFLDRGVVSLHPAYAQTLSDYKRVIKQKQRLLQDIADNGFSLTQAAEMLAPWNEQLVNLSARIHRERTDYVLRLNESLDHDLFHDQVSIRYVSSLEGKGDLNDYESLIADRLRLRLATEISAGTSLVGPHRDDLEIVFGGRDLRTFGSSGQQRSALITLDLAAISVYYSKHQDYPIFLIDDIDAELDDNRIARLLEYLDGRVQAFVTTSKRNYFERSTRVAGFYEISNGEGREELQSIASIASAGSVV
jgi:DNA replication and repair protein RecF